MCTKVISLQECSEARLGQLERVKFFPRMLLTAEDMVAESEYHREKLKRHNRFLHGTGIVCGLDVTPAPAPNPSTAIQVGSGYALSPCGDEIFVGEPVIIDLKNCGPGATTDPCEPSIIRGGNGVGATITVGIKFADCLAKPVRAMPAGCACEDEDCEYSRIRDSFQISCLEDLPTSPKFPSLCDFKEFPGSLSCPTPTEPWVFLAQVTLPSGGKPMHIDMNDRVYVFSTALIQDWLIQCCCGEDHPKPQPEPNPLLKVANVRFLAVSSADRSAPVANAILDLSSAHLNPSQLLTSPLILEANAIEVVFTGAQVNLASVDSGSFKVAAPTGNLLATIVKTNLPPNTVRWVGQGDVDTHLIVFKRATQYRLTLSGTEPGAIASVAGDALDGEDSQFPSGDGVKGGDFILNFRAS